MSEGQVAAPKQPWGESNRERATDKENEANILLGDPQRGLSVDEIADLLQLQKSSVMIYLARPDRRTDLFRRLFEEDQRVKARALGILSGRH
jgi:hypothetical protein